MKTNLHSESILAITVLAALFIERRICIYSIGKSPNSQAKAYSLSLRLLWSLLKGLTTKIYRYFAASTTQSDRVCKCRLIGLHTMRYEYDQIKDSRYRTICQTFLSVTVWISLLFSLRCYQERLVTQYAPCRFLQTRPIYFSLTI